MVFLVFGLALGRGRGHGHGHDLRQGRLGPLLGLLVLTVGVELNRRLLQNSHTSVPCAD
jgi:hypothetical protein